MDETSERFLVELTGYCYRMLGSPFEAESLMADPAPTLMPLRRAIS